MIPVILSGGSGTRLWPLSREAFPKQFLALVGSDSMLQATWHRVAPLASGAPIVVAGETHRFMVAEQLREAGCADATILLEPLARNTAPAIALAALLALEKDEDAVLLVMPSDHVIADNESFLDALEAALPMLDEDWLVTFGIAPAGPETGYGYIQSGEMLAPGLHRVARFVEKPDRARAEAMIAAGSHYWNGGIFLFRADTFVEALARHAPEMLTAARASLAAAVRSGKRIEPDEAAFAASPSDSIDYAVMEKADRVAVVPVSMGWSDVGSWDALYDLGAKDAALNSVRGDVRLLESSGNLVRSDGLRISASGIDNLIIVASGNEVMILPRGSSQDARKFSS